MTDTVDKIIIQSSTQGVQQTTNEVQGLSKAMDGVSVASQKVERSTASVEGKFSSLERRLHTTAAQARQYEKDQKTINDALAQNPALASRAAEATATLSARYAAVGKDATTAAKATGLTRSELINVSRQLQDIGVQFASGQSPLTILAQQGPQIADVFASSQGSVRGFFEQITTGASRVLTPMRVVAGGVAGIGAAALYIASNWSSAQREIDAALIGIGRRSGETRQSINRFANDNASALGLSVSEARSAAVEFAKTGNIAASSLKGVGDAVKGYSILTGKDAADATKELAGAFSGDLVAAAMKVDSVYGVMTASTLENIRVLEAQGQRAQAVQIILDRMAPINQKAAESVGILSKAWTGLTNVLSNVAGGGSLTDQRSPQAAGDDLTRRRDEFPGTSVGRNERGELKLFSDEAEKLAHFNSELAKVQPALDAINAGNAKDQLDKLSTAAFGIGNAILPQIDAIAKLDSAIRQMQEAQSKGVGPANSSGMIAVLQHQKDLQQELLQATIRQAQYVQQLQAAWGGVSSATAVTLQSLRDQANVARQITGDGQIRAQQQAIINGLLAEGKSLEEASAVAVAQSAVARASATSQVEQQTRAVKDQLAMVRAQQSGTEATTAAAIAYRQAIESGASATAAAALKSATLRLNLERAAAAALQMQDAALQAAYEQDAAAQESWSRSYRGWQNTPSTMGQGGSSRSEFYTPTLADDPIGYFGTDNELRPGPTGSSYNVTQLFEEQVRRREALLSAEAQFLGGSSNKEDKISGLEMQIESLQRGLFEHPENAWEIRGLQRAIEDLRNSTDELNETISNVTLNPLYNGRDALRVGYMGAAKGLDFIAQGPSSGDQIPVHLAVNGGERVTVQTREQQAAGNDNSRIINATINVVESRATSRRSSRQVGQKYAQMLAAHS